MKKNFRQIFSVLIVMTVLLSQMVYASPSNEKPISTTGYLDVKDDENYALAVKTLSALQILKGDENNNFNPDNTITRAEFAAVICRMLGRGEEGKTKIATEYTDVSLDFWGSGFIKIASDIGIIKGYGDEKFGPEDPVIYEQAIKVIVAAMGYTQNAEKLGGYPTGYIAVANQEGITKELEGKIGDTARRSVVAQMVFNALNVSRIEGDKKVTKIPTKPSATPSWTSQLLKKDSKDLWQYNTVTAGGKSWNIGQFDFSYAGYKYGETKGITDIPNNSRTIVGKDYEDITAKLNTAIEELGKLGGGVVNIPPGSYTVGTDGAMVDINYDNILIKGAGMGVTHLNIPGSITTNPYFNYGAFNWNGEGFWRVSPEVTTILNGKKIALGAKTFPVADASSINVGDYIVIRQIMWESFVRKHSYNGTKAPKDLEWTNYDDNNKPLFSDPQFSFAYYRKVTAKEGNTITVDVPIAYELDTANNKISVCKPSGQIYNCGMEDLTFTVDAQNGKDLEYNSEGSVLMIKGLVNGWFKNIDIASFNSLAFGMLYPVGVTFENCIAQNARNMGGGGNGYGFYMRGQNLLYKDVIHTGHVTDTLQHRPPHQI